MEGAFQTFQEWDEFVQSALHDKKHDISLNVLHVNVRSLRKHWEEFNFYLADRLHLLSVIILTEINVDDQTCNMYSLKGFHRYQLCRQGRKGGGILMFINNKYITNQINVSITQAEVLLVEVNDAVNSFTVCAIYRPPDLNIGLFIAEVSDLISSRNACKRLLIAGDINIDVRDASKYGVSDYLDMIAGYGIENMITDVTREEHLGNKITKTCIDHILVRFDDMSTMAGVIQKKLADHYFTAFVASQEIPVAGKKSEAKEISLLDNKMVDKLISEFDWNSLAHYSHTSLYEHMVTVFNNIYEKSNKTIMLKQRSPEKKWVSSEIMKLSYIKDKLWTRCKQNPGNQSLRGDFRSIRNKLTAKLRMAKRNYYLAKFKNMKDSMKETWNLVNELTGRETKTSIDDTIARHFGESVDLISLCDSFSKNFVSNVLDLRSKINYQMQTGRSQQMQNLESAYLPLMTETDLRAIISTMSIKKKTGRKR